MAEKKEGSCWDGEKGIAFFWQSTSPEPKISPLSLPHGISKVALGTAHTVLLTFNHEVFAFGDNNFGQLGFGDRNRRRDPAKLPFFEGKRVVDIACGGQHSVVLLDNGETYAWGDSSSGQCGIGKCDNNSAVDAPTKVAFTPEMKSPQSVFHLSEEKHETQPQATDVKIKSIACGDCHTLALSSRGTVWAWGLGCQTGHGSLNSIVSRPKMVEALKDKEVIGIICGAYHSIALITDNTMEIKLLPHKSGNSVFMAKGKKITQKLLKKKKETLKRKKSSGSKITSPSLLQSSDSSPNSTSSTPSINQQTSSGIRTYLSYHRGHKRDDSQGSISADDSLDANTISDGSTVQSIDDKMGPPLANTMISDSMLDHTDNISASLPVDSKESEESESNTDFCIAPSGTQCVSQPIDIQTRSNHFGYPTKTHLGLLNNSSPEPSPPYFTPNKHNDQSFVTTEIAGSLNLSTTPPQTSSVSGKPEHKGQDQGVPARSYLGFGIISSHFRPDMDLGKLTNAVVDSVAGIFMSSSPASQSAKYLRQSSSCNKCGVSGICLCSGTTGSQDRFWLPGSDTQVWTWGRGGCGQLGLGDTDDRSVPCLVEDLSSTGIIKVAAGTFHSLALTVYSQVFSWGDNSCGQLGQKKSIAVRPKKVKCFSDVLIWDIACGSHYSLFIGDMALNRPDVYICGRQPSEVAAIAEAATKSAVSTQPLSHDDITLETNPGRKPVLRHTRSCDDVKERSLVAAKIELVRLTMFRKASSIRGVVAHTENCCCLATRGNSNESTTLSELASEERLFYYQLALIWQVILVPVIKSDVWPLLLQEESGQVLMMTIKAFHQIMRCVSTNLVTVTKMVSDMLPFDGLYAGCLGKDFMAVFESYSEIFSNAVAYGSFMFFATISRNIAAQCKLILRELLEEADEDFIGDIEAFQCIAQVPLVRMQHYATLAKKYLPLLPNKSAAATRLSEVIDMWGEMMWQDEQRQLVAEQTRQFWEECPSKMSQAFRVPNRRLLRSSRTHALYPVKSTRFSSPSFVLFDDYFVHVQSNKHFQAYPLNTLWAEGMADSEPSLLNAIKITTPEDLLVLCAPCALNKADWLFAINQAVARVISKTTAYSLGAESVNTTTGNLSAAIAREACYTFQHDTRYKGAAYHGMWLTGKPHGHGEMRWPDKRVYMGEFKQGEHHGHGVMVFPPNSPDNADRYEGEWSHGKISGFGKMKYMHGDTYTGHWRDNTRHGHGVMSYGAMSSSAASVYIGEWSADRKNGYGTMDDVIRGEKYMGMWDNDIRQGAGVIVTLDGVYTQGTFVQGKLTGHGLLLCDDNTIFEGEFSGHCQLSGKGTLTLPSGDCLDGTFLGQWGDGIKINGVFTKKEKDTGAKSPSEPEMKAFVSPDRKWQALFHECREKLGCEGDQDAEPLTAWKCISRALMSSHDGRPAHAKHDVLQQLFNVGNEMERSGKYTLDAQALQDYLSKAFDMSCHPLGELVSALVYAYRATYLGMGTHRRLLAHAVAEAKSFTHRIYRITRLLFPELPNEDYVHLATDTVSGISKHHTEESTSSSAVLHPVLLPRLYPPLFTLYALHNEPSDSKYWERILLLNKRSDTALMTYVDVRRQFWLTDGSRSPSKEGEESCDVHHYVSAVEELQQMSTKLSPMEKLACLKTTFEKINQDVERFWRGEEKLVSLDDLFPVFHFVVIRARIPHLGSEIHFIDDMVDAHVHVGEQGHMFTTLKACFFQIQNEKG
ncbi:alsin [Nematostella vectensis]|uniref:alsin n=1 Tax=Nematostella vectensis TaxID=45351 RepID=UPI002076EAF0|nr:alsin [Nematostella vectensis]